MKRALYIIQYNEYIVNQSVFQYTTHNKKHSMDPTTSTVQADQQALACLIYDKIMSNIEPELMLSTIPLLDAKYAGESKEEHELRMKRYSTAYKKFEEEFSKCKVALTPAIKSAKKDALRQKEQQSLSADTAALQSIVSHF